jgi:hypothetical protein
MRVGFSAWSGSTSQDYKLYQNTVYAVTKSLFYSFSGHCIRDWRSLLTQYTLPQLLTSSPASYFKSEQSDYLDDSLQHFRITENTMKTTRPLRHSQTDANLQ